MTQLGSTGKFAYLDKHLAGRQYLMGEHFTSADILLTTCLDWAIAYGVGICDNAHPYRDRIHQRPGYRQGKEANVPLNPITPGKC